VINLNIKRFSSILFVSASIFIVGCGGGSSAPSSTGAKTTPTISWATPASITYGTALSSAQLDATANVAGTFVYTPALGSVLSAGTQTLSVTFTPTDTTDYTAATASVSLMVTVVKTTPTITWATPTNITYGTALSSTQLDATASVAGTFSYVPAAGATLSAGAQTLSVTFTPTDTTDYNPATASVSLTVNQATPVITWATPSAVLQGAALSAAQLDATASVAGSFSYSPASGNVMNTAGTIPLSTTFTPGDALDYTTATASVSLIVVPSAGTAMVDYGTSEQTIRGFGASEAWAGSVMTAAQISALYGTASGNLGLSIMRVRIAPTTWNSTTQTAGSSAWNTELSNAKAAQAYGATIFASPWSPPATMKSNGSVNEGSLNTASYADYAAYLEAYVNYATAQGVSLYAISMQNEPDWNPCPASDNGTGTGTGCYESCLWTAAQMDTWVANNASVLTTKLIMPESYSFNAAMSSTALNDSSAVGKIAIVAGHLYGASPSYPTLAKSLGKEVWMTEHFLDPATSNSGKASSWSMTIADAITEAEEIHNSMTVGQYNAYVYWWLVNSNDSTPTSLISTANVPTYYGYALAQYSRFVRPGYLRYNATATPTTGVYLSAYGGSGHQVIVVINSTTSAVTLPILIENQSVTSLTPYQTTASTNVAALSAVSLTDNTFTATLPAQSITTFVQ